MLKSIVLSLLLFFTAEVPKETARTWEAEYDSFGLSGSGLSKEAFFYAWQGFGKISLKHSVVAIADFSQSSTRKRFYVLDMVRHKLLFQTYVAHGINSGSEFATRFSNRESSNQSSLGFYRTLGTYQGKHGLSLKLEGLEKGINDLAYQRAIVLHGADYVSESFIRQTGRLGRSFGCPAVSMAEHKKLIGLLKGGAGLFLYAPSADYLSHSPFLSHPYTSG
ncbi:MAG: murein L,D-transpeptidase catalytic domain family protein [Siphonobacter aquaeclarae]|nr:murein L,D-transpeptidase catalytic domain family protein [Siphonobacter aquaeclarae]